MIPRPPRTIANFDSASAMARATAHYLRGRDFPLLGMMPRAAVPLMERIGLGINRLPAAAREQLYILSGWHEAVPPRKLARAPLERVADWMVRLYPRRPYPAAMIGSSNGAAVHLCAALGIP